MGLIFKNTGEPYFLVTNFKVMSSTLMRQPNLRQQTNEDFVRDKDTGNKYLLTRNPYDRLESFYRDKFIIYPSGCTFSEKFEWQHCEKIFLNQYDLDMNDFEETKNALINTSFDKFIRMLPYTYLFDVHLVPQIYASYYLYNSLPAKMKFNSFLKIEDEKNMTFLRDNLAIDTSINENETKSTTVPIVWDPVLRKIVNSLYQLDFEELGYDVLHN